MARVFAVRPGKWVMYWFFSARCSVDSTGEKSAPWWNNTSSAGLAEGMVVAMFAFSIDAVVSGCLGLISHSLFVVMLRDPVRIVSPMKVIRHSLERKMASQPASHSWPMDKREVLVMAGKR